MNIYLQMMILGMFLKYCYALTRIRKKKNTKKWSGTYGEGNLNVTRPSYISPQHKCHRSGVPDLVFRLDTTPVMFDVWKPA